MAYVTLKPNDESDVTKKDNWQKMVDACKASPPKEIVVPNGTSHVLGSKAVPTRVVDGCLKIRSGGGYGTEHYGHPDLTGSVCRVVSWGRCATINLCGAGAMVRDPVTWQSVYGFPSFSVEGSHKFPTGWHLWENQIFSDSQFPIIALGGYYGIDGMLVPDENHGDNCVVSRCGFFAAGCMWRSENINALNWFFGNNSFNTLGAKKEATLAIITRGGNVTIRDTSINHPWMTLFEADWYSPNTNTLTCERFVYDRPAVPDPYLTLFRYSGSLETAHYSDWELNITGKAATYLTPMENKYNNPWFKVPANMPRENWHYKVQGLN